MTEQDEFSNFFSNAITTEIAFEEVNKDALFQKISSTIQSILDEKFVTDSISKRKILYPSDNKRMNFACPYCGDSRNNPNKKRGNIYLDDLNFKCYNCSTFKDVITLLSDYGKKDNFTDAELAYLKRNSLEHNSADHGPLSSNSKNNISDMSVIMNGIEQYAIPREEIMSALRLKEITNDKVIYRYLQDRKQLDNEKVFKKMAYDAWNEVLYFFNLTKSGNVMGLQGRVQNVKRGGQRFNTYEYSRIVKDILRLPEPSDDIKIQTDKISIIYNIFDVNMSKDIYIFEGSIDANHYENSMATWSASNKVYIPNGKYCFDNTLIDKAGKDATIELLSKGHMTFLWQKFVDKYPKFRYCKDLNDIMKLENLPLSEFNKFFGNSMLDLLYI